MSEKDKCKTISFRALAQETEATGLVSEEMVQTLQAEKLKAQEQIRAAKLLALEGLLSVEESTKRIAKIKQELMEKMAAIGLMEDLDNL